MIKSSDIKKELKKVSNTKRAKGSARYFKTAKGQYGEGDIFIGVTVPDQRKIAKKFFKDIELLELQKLLKSSIHEHRFTALEILVFKFEKEPVKIFVDFYLKNLKYVNNWDLVDTSAYLILGKWLLNRKDRKVLYQLAKSESLWRNRVAIISTFAFIKNGFFEDTLRISKILLSHKHDLIHKAVGWMLREVGNRDIETEEKFLKRNYEEIPRTALRYAIEKFPEKKRKAYLYAKM